MNKIQQITGYYLQKSNNRSISKMRLIKIIYLCDWFFALVHNERMTDLDWKYHYCIETSCLDNQIRYCHPFSISMSKGIIEREEYTLLFSLNDSDFSLLDEKEKKVLDYVVEKTENLFYNDLLNFVYSTYPLQEDTIYRRIDLLASAARFHEKNNKTDSVTTFDRKEQFSFDF